jgi:hypothetical protein
MMHGSQTGNAAFHAEGKSSVHPAMSARGPFVGHLRMRRAIASPPQRYEAQALADWLVAEQEKF